jgi:hypothetical protein
MSIDDSTVVGRGRARVLYGKKAVDTDVATPSRCRFSATVRAQEVHVVRPALGGFASWCSIVAAATLVAGSAPLARAAADESSSAQRGRAGTPSTSSEGWDLALTGGFVANGLIDPVYALGTIPGRPTRVVIRETDKENTVTLGLAMFAQVHHDRLPWIAPLSFGVGIRADGRATFYLGPAVRFGQRASFTAGVAVGPIAALPAGVHERESVTDTNFLSNLGTRNTKAWYAAVTYTFASLR